MSLKQFLPFLTDDQGRSLDVDNGVVVTRSIPNALDDSPNGWEDNTIQYSRNKELKGTITAYITNLIFYFSGARILREYYYKMSRNAAIYFIWLKLDQRFGGELRHRDWYKGQPDFTTFRDGYDGVQINISEAGFFREYQANKTVPYEYKFKDDWDACSVLLDGTYIEQATNYLITDGDPLANHYGNHSLAMEVVSQEALDSVDTANQNRYRFSSNADLLSNVQYFHKTGAGEEKIEINVTLMVKPSSAPGITEPYAGGAFVIRSFDDADNPSSYVLHQWGNTGSVVGFFGSWHLINLTTTITVPPKRRLFALMLYTIAGAFPAYPADAACGWEYLISENYFFRTKNYFLFDNTIEDAFRAITVGEKLCRSMSNKRSGLQSDLLSNDYNLLITTGDAIRGFDDATIKTKFTDWYRSIDAVKCIGMKVWKNQAKIESRYDFYTSTQISNLGVAKIPNTGFITPANEYIFNLIEAGYPDTDLRSINGKYSFLGPVTLKSPLLDNENTYDCRSVYKADPYVIELTRINASGKKTTDSSTDNDVFFLDCEKAVNDFSGIIDVQQESAEVGKITLFGILGLELKPKMRFRILQGLNIKAYQVLTAVEIGADTIIYIKGTVNDETIDTTVEFMHYKLRRKSYVSISGIPSPETIFNVELSVMRNLMNHYRWLRSGWEHIDNLKVTFQTTSKNDAVITEDSNGIIIKERDDILIANMGDPVFMPHFFSFEVASPNNLKEMMDADDTGYFSFTADSTTYTGFPEDIKSNEATLETQDYKLLAAPGNNFTNRIKST